jgi:hypothetical protein
VHYLIASVCGELFSDNSNQCVEVFNFIIAGDALPVVAHDTIHTTDRVKEGELERQVRCLRSEDAGLSLDDSMMSTDLTLSRSVAIDILPGEDFKSFSESYIFAKVSNVVDSVGNSGIWGITNSFRLKRE